MFDLQAETTKFNCIFNKQNYGLYKSSNTYPYPRTHSLVVVPSTRPIAPEDDDNQSTSVSRPKPRPPLNRAIPPIPESRSNDSIMTQASERKISVAENNTAVVICDTQTTSVNDVANGSSKAAKNLVKQISTEKCVDDDYSLVIENKLAQNLAAKNPVSITAKKSRLSETPKSPLMSVAHSVLSKLGNRFGRSETRPNLRTTTSMSRFEL
ncbi:unnamed protein product [Enterobius vermicularis]|uniref:WH2 domain-containing protein n=1 Tax=Enterobius vermicularis TaxID=51028 RepID=A0A0N4VN58_ENTVE|nr:unnamed protein product [Enterobius vermicularis]